MKVFCALYHLYFHVLHKIWITLDWTFCSMMLEHIQNSLKNSLLKLIFNVILKNMRINFSLLIK
jgi:hypothetical protein